MNFLKIFCTVIFASCLLPISYAQDFSNASPEKKEVIAQNMLLFQRSNGGWPKHFKEKSIDYSKPLTEADLIIVKASYASGKDATIDNYATIKEIRFLAGYFAESNKKEYLDAVEKGISYLLKAQYANGGWPQFYPDLSNYRHLITYNDNAMVNVLTLLQDVNEGKNNMGIVDKSFIGKASVAVKKGIDCILKSQIKVDGKLTVWCAQHDEKTLQPANARSFELISLSGSESAAIVQFLMNQKNPSEEMKNAIVNAVKWFDQAKIRGYKFEVSRDPVKGKQQNLVKDANSVIWARFYDISSGEPFFSGRDGVKKKSIYEIEAERRNGYAWYGTWPGKVLKEYPKWASINRVNSVTVK